MKTRLDLIHRVLRAAGHALPLNPIQERAYLALLSLLRSQPGPNVVRVPYGMRFRVFRTPQHSLVNNPDFYIYYFGTWESRQSRAVRRLVRRGAVCVDAGANAGWYTLLLSRIVGPGGLVFSFEPHPTAFAQLEENLALNEWAVNVRAESAALGERAGEATLHDGGHSMYSSLYKVRREVDVATRIVRRESLDAYLADQHVQRVDFLKCDVEGAELDVLRGASALFQSATPPVVQLELNRATARAAERSATDAVAWLVDTADYTVYRPTLTGRLVPASPADLRSEVIDVFCLPPSCAPIRAA